MRRPVLLWLTALLAGCRDGGGFLVTAQPEAVASAAAAAEAPAVVLPLEVDAELADTFVRLGYGLHPGPPFQSTEFLTPRLRTTQAAPLIRLVERYNDFEGDRVAAAVAALRGRVAGVQFGREGSPVLYLELPHWTHQREETPAGQAGSKIAEADHERLVAELRRVFVDDLKAQAFTANRRRLRIWWD